MTKEGANIEVELAKKPPAIISSPTKMDSLEDNIDSMSVMSEIVPNPRFNDTMSFDSDISRLMFNKSHKANLEKVKIVGERTRSESSSSDDDSWEDELSDSRSSFSNHESGFDTTLGSINSGETGMTSFV